MFVASGSQMSSNDMEIQRVAAEISQLTRKLVRLSGAGYQEEGVPSDVQEQLLHYEKENDQLHNRIARLNDEHNEASAQLLGQLQTAVVERDEALVKLRHARRVIRDLVDERPDIATLTRPVSQEDIDSVLLEDSPSTDSDKTVRPRGDLGRGPTLPLMSGEAARSPQQLHAQSSNYPISPPPSNPGLSSTLSPQQFNRPFASSGKGKRPLTQSASMSSVEPTSGWRGTGGSSSSAGAPPVNGPHLDLIIHFTKPPGSSVLIGSGIKTDVLVRALKLDETKEDAVRRLIEMNPTLSTKITFLDTWAGPVVCLFKPIFADGKEIPRSYLVDWNATENSLNQKVVRYIDGYIEDGRRPYHVFAFVKPRPNEEGFWVSIGAHKMQWAQLHDMWKTLDAGSQRKLVSKLSERVNLDDEFDVKSNLVRMLDSGELAQMSLLLIPEDRKVSEEFARKVLD